MTANRSKARVQIDAEPVEKPKPKKRIRRRMSRRTKSDSSRIQTERSSAPHSTKEQRTTNSTSSRRRTPGLRDRRPPPRGIKQLVPVFRKNKETPKGYDESLKVTPLGGLGEVGRNMTVFEYKDEIIIVDIGFGFPENDQPGIDYNIPNIDYLKDKTE